ncbi:DNA-directed RNA polymerase specialized sigma24 family protein [Paenibacillus sp. PastF-3]|uniref:hypothetical protein n=1 Tax=unclassified Paenibacillus TaxID=185978 RepID=UPI000BA1446E|nr:MULTISPECIES: hypothetical protein [unclassified Paenibacillus]MDH6372902.1 DNA-directed RNA polymerase specialized sigma24 family protein [Paenibacillus sp. PastF-3]OZQ85755.1 hypothetical protein CA598_20030 [Paenibacillus sp. VTT E-133291]
MSSYLEMKASYQSDRSKALKGRNRKTVVHLGDYFSQEEKEALLNHRLSSSAVSSCNFALDTLGIRGEKIDEELLKLLDPVEEKVIVLRIEKQEDFSSISDTCQIPIREVMEILRKATRKITTFIRLNRIQK